MFEQYDKAVQTDLEYLVEQGFTKTPRKYFCQATREFRRYLEESCLEYTHSIAKTVCRSVLSGSLMNTSSEGGRTATSHQHYRWIPVRALGSCCTCNRRTLQT